MPKGPKAPKIILPATLRNEGKVVICGGGPAGIHMGMLLAKKGCKNIILLEAENSLGGKSYTVRDSVEGVSHDLGTCYLHPLYDPILKLKREYDPNNDLIAIDHISRTFAADLRGGDDNSYLHGKSFSEFVVEKAHAVYALPRGCFPCLPTIVGACGFASAVARYSSVHRKIFGKYDYGMPPQPKEWALIDMQGIEFLEKYDLKELEGFIRYAQEVQGYGTLETVHAFYLCWWIHPLLLRRIVDAIVKGKPAIWLLQRGFQQLWQSIARVHEDVITVITGAQVTCLSRDPHSVSYEKNGIVQTVYCDFIVMALDLSRFTNIVLDLDIKEKSLFASECFERSTLCTTLYEADHAGSHENAVELWFKRIVPEPGSNCPEGRLYAHRNSRLTVALGNIDGNPMGSKVQPAPDDEGRQRRVAYQYLGRALVPTTDPEILKNQLLSDLENIGETNVRLIEQKPWEYSPKFNKDALREGRPWQVLANQGHKKTIWIGSSVCFESVLDCVCYNEKLLKSMTFSS